MHQLRVLATRRRLTVVVFVAVRLWRFRVVLTDAIKCELRVDAAESGQFLKRLR